MGPGRIFRVRYPRSLIPCSHLDGENPDVWSPQECISEIPVCDNSGHEGNVLLCLAYPIKELPHTELQAAAFAVSRIDNLRTAHDCDTKFPRANTKYLPEEKIAGTRFDVAEAEESGSGHVNRENLYRAFHADACYEIDITLDFALDSAFAAEDAPRKLTPAQQQEVKSTLGLALQGFRFTK